jgi:hypothetical protein
MAAEKDKGTDLVPFANYAVAQFDTSDLQEVLTENFGGGDINLDRDLDRIKVPSGGGLQWRVPTLEGDEDRSELTGVIVLWKNVRQYYATSFDEAPNMPPTCSSPDGVIGLGHPDHEGADDPEGPPITRECATCPQAQWGSGNGKGQACQQNRLLFMLTEGDMLPLVVKLPATSIKPCAEYFKKLTRTGKPFFAVQTKITLERSKSGDGIEYSEARFAMGAALTKDEVSMMRGYKQALQPAAASMTGAEVTKADVPGTAEEL